MRDLLRETADLAADFLESLDRAAGLAARSTWRRLRARMGGPVPEGPSDPSAVVAELAAVGSEAAVAIPGGRYFGFVIGGSVPAALAADWLTSTWDQNAGLYVAGAAAAVAEETAGRWLADLLKIPRATSFAFVTGTQMAHATAMAAARNHVLHEVGWDVEEKGLTGAPPIRVFAGEKAPFDVPARAALHRPRHGSIERIRRRRPGPDAHRRAARRARGARRAGDRLRQGRRGEHRLVRRRSTRSPTRPKPREPGSTSTAPSGCGRPRARGSRSSSPARSAPTPGPQTATSG